MFLLIFLGLEMRLFINLNYLMVLVFQFFLVMGFFINCRLEFDFFGIDVIDVVLGGIKLNLVNLVVDVFKKMFELKLYKVYEEGMIERLFFFQRRKLIFVEIFVKDIVVVVLKKNLLVWFLLGRYFIFMVIMYYMFIWFKDFFQRKVLMKKG